MHMMNSSMGGNGNQVAEGSRDGSASNVNSRSDGAGAGAAAVGHAREGNGVAGEESEGSYLKSSE